MVLVVLGDEEVLVVHLHDGDLQVVVTLVLQAMDHLHLCLWVGVHLKGGLPQVTMTLGMIHLL
jgi:hypothetical protein